MRREAALTACWGDRLPAARRRLLSASRQPPGETGSPIFVSIRATVRRTPAAGRTKPVFRFSYPFAPRLEERRPPSGTGFRISVSTRVTVRFSGAGPSSGQSARLRYRRRHHYRPPCPPIPPRLPTCALTRRSVPGPATPAGTISEEGHDGAPAHGGHNWPNCNRSIDRRHGPNCAKQQNQHDQKIEHPSCFLKDLEHPEAAKRERFAGVRLILFNDVRKHDAIAPLCNESAQPPIIGMECQLYAPALQRDQRGYQFGRARPVDKRA